MHAVIFDVDGTLWDSTEKVALSWRETCTRLKIPCEHITGERLKSEFGKLLSDIGRSLFPDLTTEESLDLIAKACAEENEYLRRDPPSLFPEVAELFAELKKRGIPAYIVSNCECGYIEAMMDVTGLKELVSGHLCAGDTLTDKAGTMRILIEEKGIQSPVYVGDTLGDYHSTKEVGIPFVFAAYGFGNVPSPDAVIRHPLELLDVLPLI